MKILSSLSRLGVCAPRLPISLIWRGICIFLILWFGVTTISLAEPLADRLAQFPQWESKPPVQVAEGDLVYPDWMAGTWQVTSTLVDLVAPLAPEIVTPGFEGNRRYLNQPVQFQVRFVKEHSPIALGKKKRIVPLLKAGESSVVADRSFNGLNIALAYLGEEQKDVKDMPSKATRLLSVKVDPNNPNRQITSLSRERQLVSVVTGRASEMPSSDRFIATEITQQVFQGRSQIYLNEVETTTAYQLMSSGAVSEARRGAIALAPVPKAIAADQVTAIYLSPQDPDYFAATGHPVALYRYQLELLPADR